MGLKCRLQHKNRLDCYALCLEINLVTLLKFWLENSGCKSKNITVVLFVLHVKKLLDSIA